MVKVHRSFVAAVALLALFAAGACTQATHIDSNAAHEYRSRVELGPFERGWSRVWVGRLVERPQVIAHHVEIQADLAGNLVRLERGELRSIVGERACPSPDDPIWKRLESGQDIEVELRTAKNGPFATVSCRSALF